jgi:sugar lactone lactonase YvrE
VTSAPSSGPTHPSRTRPVVVPVPGPGAEDVVVGTHGRDEGAVFTGTADGSIWRVSHDARHIDRVATTGGRPLGIELDRDGRLLVCDAHRGVLRVDPATGGVETVLDRVGGRAMAFCNNAAVTGDGEVWFSDSSAHFGIERWKDDFVQDTRSGRLLRLGTDGEVEVVLEGLAFANGVALSRGEDFVAVAESAARTVVRLWTAGERAGTRDHLVADLPGYPDNIARGSDGLIWVTIGAPKVPVLEVLLRMPSLLRRAVARVPERFLPRPARTLRVQAYDDSGRLVHDLDLDPTHFHMATGVREHEGRVWIGSLVEPAVAWHDL